MGRGAWKEGKGISSKLVISFFFSFEDWNPTKEIGCAS
jgi:hypothetical protein